MLRETDENDAAQCDYAYGNYLDEVLFMVADPADTATTYYIACDHLYSPSALLDDAGTVLERYEYDAYGQRRVYDPDFTDERSTSDYTLTIAFTGQRLDLLDEDALPLMYYKNRSYSPSLARFLQRDPLEYVDGANLYEYTISSPVNFVDPYGEKIKVRKLIKKSLSEFVSILLKHLLMEYGVRIHIIKEFGPTACTPPLVRRELARFESISYAEGKITKAGFFTGKHRKKEEWGPMALEKLTVKIYTCICPCPDGYVWRVVKTMKNSSKDTAPWTEIDYDLLPDWLPSSDFGDEVKVWEKHWKKNEYRKWGCRRKARIWLPAYGFLDP